jgi:hypothetical protein
MQHIEFAVLVGLLISVLWRMPTPWRVGMMNVIILRKLNRLESQLRNIPLDQVDRELGEEIRGIASRESGRPWLAERYWEHFPSNER